MKPQKPNKRLQKPQKPQHKTPRASQKRQNTVSLKIPPSFDIFASCPTSDCLLSTFTKKRNNTKRITFGPFLTGFLFRQMKHIISRSQDSVCNVVKPCLRPQFSMPRQSKAQVLRRFVLWTFKLSVLSVCRVPNCLNHSWLVAHLEKKSSCNLMLAKHLRTIQGRWDLSKS